MDVEQGGRQERHLMRQRGAGARAIDANFGFIFKAGPRPLPTPPPSQESPKPAAPVHADALDIAPQPYRKIATKQVQCNSTQPETVRQHDAKEAPVPGTIEHTASQEIDVTKPTRKPVKKRKALFTKKKPATSRSKSTGAPTQGSDNVEFVGPLKDTLVAVREQPRTYQDNDQDDELSVENLVSAKVPAGRKGKQVAEGPVLKRRKVNKEDGVPTFESTTSSQPDQDAKIKSTSIAKKQGNTKRSVQLLEEDAIPASDVAQSKGSSKEAGVKRTTRPKQDDDEGHHEDKPAPALQKKVARRKLFDDGAEAHFIESADIQQDQMAAISLHEGLQSSRYYTPEMTGQKTTIKRKRKIVSVPQDMVPEIKLEADSKPSKRVKKVVPKSIMEEDKVLEIRSEPDAKPSKRVRKVVPKTMMTEGNDFKPEAIPVNVAGTLDLTKHASTPSAADATPPPKKVVRKVRRVKETHDVKSAQDEVYTPPALATHESARREQGDQSHQSHQGNRKPLMEQDVNCSSPQKVKAADFLDLPKPTATKSKKATHTRVGTTTKPALQKIANAAHKQEGLDQSPRSNKGEDLDEDLFAPMTAATSFSFTSKSTSTKPARKTAKFGRTRALRSLPADDEDLSEIFDGIAAIAATSSCKPVATTGRRSRKK